MEAKTLIWKLTIMPTMLADVIKDAIAAADDHVKIAQEMLAVAQNVLEMLRVADDNNHKRSNSSHGR